MPTASPSPILVPLALLALAACSAGMEPAGCHSDDTCPAGSRCQERVCVADGRPTASIQPVGPVEAFALVLLDGSASQDPDRGDAIADYGWTVRSVTARCAPPEIAGRTPVARVRFGCPGRYEVTLAVRDRLDLESEPRTLEVDVGPSTLAPLVSAGPDVSSEHACSGVPLVCRTTDSIPLSASATAGVSLRWAVEPPLDLPVEDGTRRVRISGNPAAASAVIETDGTAISGDWIFRAEAYDEYGVIGAAYTRVSVQNRPPVLIANPPGPFPHAFDAVRSVFTSSGAIPWTAFDPDGDPVDVSAVWRHVGDGGASFAGGLGAGSVTFAVEVPYAAPEDALSLIGGPGLARTVELFARDCNRSETRASIPVEIGNRPPEPVPSTVDARVPHRFDPLRSRYVASARLGAWTDPDGDPLFAVAGEGPCDAFSFVDGGALTVECSAPYEGTPAADRIVGRRSVPARVRDPWSDASTVALYTLEILNSPPSLSSTTDPATVCSQTTLGFGTGFYPCLLHTVSAVTFTVSPTATDPDGDPILLMPIPVAGGTATPQKAICTTADCVPIRFFQPELSWRCSRDLSTYSRLAASDGAAAAEMVVSPHPTGC